MSDSGTGPRQDLNAPRDDLSIRLRAAVVDRYELKELLGRGGMGAVFLAVDRKLERPVAIKVLPPELGHDQNVVERFEREARTAARLDHPNIIPIYSVESHHDFHYFVMKFVSGRSLEDIIISGPMPVEVTQRILWEASCALGHAHQRGVVHRDIKPANIMIDETGHTVLTDFGISKAVQSATQHLTATGQVVGTPHYMSPEQSKGVGVDGRSDQYSLAVVGFRMLTGKLPFEEDSIHAVLYKKLFEEPPWVKDLRDGIPDHMAEALHTALAKEPERRYANMEAFATAIWPENPVEEPRRSRSSAARISLASIEGDTQIATSEPPTPRKRKRKRSRAGLFAATAVVVLGGAAGSAYWLDRQGLFDRITQSPNGSAVMAATIDSLEPAPAATDDSGTVDTAGSATPPPDTGGVEPETVAQQPDPSPPVTQQRSPPVRRPTVQPQRPAPPPVGYVTIDADPFGSVWINNVYVKDTPLIRHELRSGTYLIEVRRDGWQTVVDTVRVTAGNTYSKRHILVRKPL